MDDEKENEGYIFKNNIKKKLLSRHSTHSSSRFDVFDATMTTRLAHRRERPPDKQTAIGYVYEIGGCKNLIFHGV